MSVVWYYIAMVWFVALQVGWVYYCNGNFLTPAPMLDSGDQSHIPMNHFSVLFSKS